ncbi:MAG: NUDIX hydrolase [Aigarchaeota archaeon]|nr:NUDIX hydrolase [Candidatus Pelearchaeum maunauluense]
MDKPEETISSEVVFRGRVFSVVRDRVRHGSREYVREVVVHPGAVAIIAMTGAGELLLVRQFRYPAGRYLVEIPAGTLEEGESPENCAMRELEEETGYKAGKIEKITEFFLAPGYSTERIHLFIAYELERSTASPDVDEHITLLKARVEEALAMIEKGEIIDAKTIAALLYLKHKHREVFNV